MSNVKHHLVFAAAELVSHSTVLQTSLVCYLFALQVQSCRFQMLQGWFDSTANCNSVLADCSKTSLICII